MFSSLVSQWDNKEEIGGEVEHKSSSEPDKASSYSVSVFIYFLFQQTNYFKKQIKKLKYRKQHKINHFTVCRKRSWAVQCLTVDLSTITSLCGRAQCLLPSLTYVPMILGGSYLSIMRLFNQNTAWKINWEWTQPLKLVIITLGMRGHSRREVKVEEMAEQRNSMNHK